MLDTREKFKIFEEDPQVAQFDELISVNENLELINKSLKETSKKTTNELQESMKDVGRKFEILLNLENKISLLEKAIEQRLRKIETMNAERTLDDLRPLLEKIRGPKGDKGDRGDRGLTGDVGETGPQGEKGESGDDGKNGEPGVAGRDGRDGKPGKDGKRGPMPRHKWEGTTLFFELPNGQWGKGVNLADKRLGSAYPGGFFRSGPSFIDRATPTGSVDGVNTIFVLPSVPEGNTEHVYVNGQLQTVTDDYTISSKTITFIIAPPPGSKIRVSYRG